MFLFRNKLAIRFLSVLSLLMAIIVLYFVSLQTGTEEYVQPKKVAGLPLLISVFLPLGTALFLILSKHKKDRQNNSASKHSALLFGIWIGVVLVGLTVGVTLR
ncbi:hypothetical protein KFE96_05300 [Kordiimonas sp. SCSIO 12603]|uniref:hypothetical protein n=1 Tax=Kordiimonas sp. SCSIO 12603 TaxID=2829596 RepID=UPI0021085DC3|nr:hypothetical protein [Kordiimonas sp. SCSIO 12603]UTW59721.1 hypothetical protein KFE96_05300 [Kordiimonas sp. SCSIO 12603]